MQRAYKASGELGQGNALSLISVAMGVGAAAGIVEGLVQQWFSLFLIFPAIIGAAAGITVDRFVAKKHVRAPALAFVAGLVGGSVGQAAMHCVSYEMFRNAVHARIVDEANDDGGAPPDSPDAVMQQVLQEKTGHQGIVGYLLIQADEGVQVRNHGEKGLSFTGLGYWCLFALEFLIAGLCGAFIGQARAKQPYCENCKRWYDKEEILALGSGDKSAVAAVKAALDKEAWSEAASALGTPGEKEFSSITGQRCTQCEMNERVVTLRRTVNAKKKPQTKEAWSSVMRFEEVKALQAALPAKTSTAG